jgi:hypothetical protein
MKTKMKTKIVFGLIFGSFSLFAQEKDSTKGELNVSGYLDAYYFYNANNPQNGMNNGASGFARAFDQRANQTQVGLVQTKLNYTHRNSEAVIDLTFGQNADLGNYGNVIGAFGAGNATTALAIKQAYFSYNATDKLKFTAGQFGTHIGYEVIDAPTNFNYSLSNLFNNGPFYHVGVKGEYAINDKFSWMVGLVNNWDNAYDNNKYKTVISQIAYAPNDKLSIYVNYIGGDEIGTAKANEKDTLHNFKQMFDLVATYQATDKLFFGINAAEGIISKTDYTAYWGGVALYSNYAFSDVFTLGARGEFFDNTSGAQYIGNARVQSYTLTGQFTLADGHLFVKPEIRMDAFSKVEGLANVNMQQFMDKDGLYSKNTQTTFGLALVYKY